MKHRRRGAQRPGSKYTAFPLGEKLRIEQLVGSGQLDQAREIAERVCRKFHRNPEAWFLLGAVCGHQGDFTRAVACCRHTVQLAPQVAAGHFNLGVALNQAGHSREAVASLKKALALQPAFADACRELGNIYATLGDFQKAVEVFTRLVQLQPAETHAWVALGNLYEKLSDLSEAERCYRKAQETGTHSVTPGLNLGNVLKAQGKNDEAECCYLALLNVAPDSVDAMYNLAVLYQSMQRYTDAESRYRSVLELSHTHEMSLNNLGLVLMAQSRFDEAIDSFTTLLRIRPDFPDALRNLSAVYREQNKLDLAEQPLNSILATAPDCVAARQDRSLLWLQQGRFDCGWDEYEWRNAGLDIAERWPFPAWDGMLTPDKTVLVFPEQGIGDEIMFASCIPDLCRAAARVILVCDDRLEALFQRSFPAASVVGRNPEQGAEWLDRLPCVDAQVSIASLPKFFRRHEEDFTTCVDAYLKASPGALKKWRSRYSALGAGLKVGLSWRGGHVSNTQLKRSIPLEQWGDILRLSNLHFVNLQYGDCMAELEAVQRRYAISIHDWDDSDPLVDMDDFSAKVQALDLVLSIDNSTVHLSGALGVRTWVLQPYSPDWRWIPEQDGSYWYPSVKQYRQTVPGQWHTVLVRVAKELAHCARDNGD